MADEPVVLALDQGTTSSRAIAFDRRGTPVASAQREFPQGFPSPGHVTHDPEDIWSSQLRVAREVIDAVGGARSVAAIGITNQRETTIVWERATGRPVAPAIVWQSRITAPFCDQLRAAGHEPFIRERTGLPLDAYFSGPKIRHILQEGNLRTRAERGELAFGTVDTWLAWRLTGGRIHATDVSNASRTLLLDIRTLDWDDDLLRLMEVPRRDASGRAAIVRRLGRDGSRPVRPRRSRSRGWRAISRRRCSARHASSPAKPRTRTGPARSCWRTWATGRSPSGHGLLSTVLWQLGDGWTRRLRARRLGVHRRGGRPVAARRAPCRVHGGRDRGAGTRRRGHGRRLSRPGVRGPGRPALGPRCTRPARSA